jgi:hypothetical protein
LQIAREPGFGGRVLARWHEWMNGGERNGIERRLRGELAGFGGEISVARERLWQGHGGGLGGGLGGVGAGKTGEFRFFAG